MGYGTDNTANEGGYVHPRTGRRWATEAMAIQMDGALVSPAPIGPGQTGILVQTGEFAGNFTGVIEPMQVNYKFDEPITKEQFINPATRPAAITPTSYGVNPSYYATPNPANPQASQINNPIAPNAPFSPVSGAGAGTTDNRPVNHPASQPVSDAAGMLSLPLIIGAGAVILVIVLFMSVFRIGRGSTA